MAILGPLGYQAIVENAHFGLLYRDNVTTPLQIGQRVKACVRNIHPNALHYGKHNPNWDPASGNLTGTA
jgi:hypothetical protein